MPGPLVDAQHGGRVRALRQAVDEARLRIGPGLLEDDPLVGLDREVGPVRLGELPTGAVRPLTKKEIDSLQRAIAHGRTPRGESCPANDKPIKHGNQKIHHRGHRERRESRTVIQ